MSVEGYFFDGKTSRQHEVIFGYAHQQLIIKTEHARYYWQEEDVELLSNIYDGLPIRLGNKQFSDQRLEVHDALAWQRIQDAYPRLEYTRFHVPANIKTVMAALAISALLVWVVYASIPAVSTALAPLVPQSAKTALSDMVREELLKDSATCKNAEGAAALRTIKARLNIPNTISLQVVDHKMANAFTLPDDSITIFNGLLQQATSADEVAGVIAHELGHVEHQHNAKNIVRALGTNFLFALMTGGTSSAVDGKTLLNYLMQTGFQRDMEHEADDFAVRKMQQTHVDLEGYLDFFERSHDTAGTLGYLSTHPSNKKRLERILQQLDHYQKQPILHDDAWNALRHICKN